MSCIQAKADFFEKQRQQAEAEAQARFLQNSLHFLINVFFVEGGIGCLLDLPQVQQAHYGLSCRSPAVRRIADPHSAAHSLLILLILQNAPSAVHCSRPHCLLILLYYAILCYANNNYRAIPNCPLYTTVQEGRILEALDKEWHASCFVCNRCNKA